MNKLVKNLAVALDNYPPDPLFSVEQMFQESRSEPDSLAGMLSADPPSEYETPPNNKNGYVEWFKRRTKKAAIEVINLMEKTVNSPGMNVVRFQLIKSATSTAANYRAACRARSSNEFFAKICIVVEEADETQFWLEILEESVINIDKPAVKNFHREWTEIVKITTSAKAKAALKK